MPKEIKIRNIAADKGTKARGHVRVYDTSTWSLDLPVTIVNGAKDGPVLCLTAGFHPHEYTGIETVIRLASKLQPEALSGSVIALPCINVAGFQKRMRNNPVDDSNMHREFPGNPKGKSSQQVAWFLSNEVLKQSTHYIDNHGADFGEVAPNHVIYPVVGNAKVDEVSEMMGKCFNGDYLRAHKATDTLSALSWAAANGIPSILSEAGQLGGLTLGQLDEKDIAWNTEGILNTMRYLKMINGSANFKQPVMISNEAHLASSVAGMFYSKVRIGDEVKVGQVVGEIKDMFGNLKEQLVAPINGVVSLIWFYTAVEAGANLIQILETSK